MHDELTALGSGSHLAPFDAFWGQRYATVLDPDGVRVDLYAAAGAGRGLTARPREDRRRGAPGPAGGAASAAGPDPDRRSRPDCRRPGCPAFHRPGHRLPLGDGEDGASVHRRRRACPVRRPHPDPAPRDAPHPLAGHPGRGADDPRCGHPQAGGSRTHPADQGAGRERHRRSRGVARRRPETGPRLPRTERPDTGPRPRPAGARVAAAAGAGSGPVGHDGGGAHAGASPARLRGRGAARTAARVLGERCLRVRVGPVLAAGRPR